MKSQIHWQKYPWRSTCGTPLNLQADHSEKSGKGVQMWQKLWYISTRHPDSPQRSENWFHTGCVCSAGSRRIGLRQLGWRFCCSWYWKLPGWPKPAKQTVKMEAKGVKFQPMTPQAASTGLGAKQRRGTPTSGSKFVHELLTPPGKQSRAQTDYEQLLSQFNKIPQHQSLLLMAALGAIIFAGSLAVPYWRCVLIPLSEGRIYITAVSVCSHTSYRGIVYQLRRDYQLYSRIGESLLGYTNQPSIHCRYRIQACYLVSALWHCHCIRQFDGSFCSGNLMGWCI